MKTNKKLSAYALALTVSFSAQNNEALAKPVENNKVLSPVIQTTQKDGSVKNYPLTVNCKEDFSNENPTDDFLKYLDKQLHDGREGTIAFLLSSDEEQAAQFKNMHPLQKRIFNHLAKQYARADNKTEFLQKTLEQNHPALKKTQFFAGAKLHCYQ